MLPQQYVHVATKTQYPFPRVARCPTHHKGYGLKSFRDRSLSLSVRKVRFAYWFSTSQKAERRNLAQVAESHLRFSYAFSYFSIWSLRRP